MPRSPSRFALLLAASLGVAACAAGPTELVGPAPALTALPRALSPAERSIIDASNAFAFALFDTISTAQRDTNVFISPLSASLALGMTLNGAAGATYDEMRAALQFGSASQQEIDAGYRSLVALLLTLDPSVQLRIANSIWYARPFAVHQDFLDTAKTYFDAQVTPLDFADAARSLATINGWVKDRTGGKIPTILDGIDANDRMFLIDAIYFRGDWRARFDPAATQSSQFHAADGTRQPVQLMQRTGTMSYAAGAGWQAVDLPYGDSAFTMTVLLPAPGVTVDALVDSLTPDFWSALTTRLAPQQVELYLPKLKLSYGRQLNGDLEALGMRRAFDPMQADFSRMTTQPVYVDFVRQKSYVDVDEKGTEAAAATAVGIVVTAVPAYEVMRVDRPYLFVIRERLSGTLLFMAKIVSMPTA